jgi:hypothetical protein
MFRRNTPTAVGAVATAAFTAVLIYVPNAVQFDLFRASLVDQTGIYLWDNPFPPLRYLGGFGGGFVAGYLTRDLWYEAVINAFHAVLAGIFLYYVGLFLYKVVAFSSLLSPSVVLVFLLQPLIFLVVPFSLIYLFEGLLGSLFSRGVRQVLHARINAETRPDLTESELRGIRTTLAALSLLLMLALVWWFGFRFEAVY